MQKDLNPNPCSSLVIVWACDGQAGIFLEASLG